MLPWPAPAPHNSTSPGIQESAQYQLSQQQTQPLPVAIPSSDPGNSVNPPIPSIKRRYARMVAAPDLRGLMLVVVAGAWLVGILLSSWVLLPSLILLLGAGAALLGVILLWHKNWGRLILLAILWLLLGAWRYTTVSPIGDPQAISAFLGSGKIEVRGTVADEPKLQERSSLLVISVNAISTDNGTTWQDAHGQLEALTPGALIDNPYGPNYGDSVELQGKLQPPPPHSLPNISASMVFPRISVSNAGGNPIIAALYQLRTRLATIITQTLPQPEAALLIAILLSLKIPPLKPLIPFFNETGTAHLIAPSGFKVTILAGLVVTSAKGLYEKREKQGKPLPAQKRKGNMLRWLSTSPVILSIAAYTLLSGAGPAAVRAGIMGILLVVAPRLGRIYNIYTALALTALLMSLLDPFVLWDAGFQLSFLGTLGIVILTPLFQRMLRPIARLRFGHYIAEITAVTLAAQVATLPIIALTFNTVSFIAPLVNILTVPLLAMLIVLGAFVCGAGLLFTQLGIICGWVVWPLLWYVANVVTWCARLPGAYLSINNLDSGLAWCYYGLLTIVVIIALRRWPESKQPHQMLNSSPLFSQGTWRKMQFGAALLVILATGATALAAQPNGQLTITFLSVGPLGQPQQGEAVLISTPDGKTALIDGGLDAASLSSQLDSRLPFWQRSLDVVVLTTPQAENLGGLQDVVNRYQVGEVLDAGMLHPSTAYALWRRTISERNLDYVQLQQGATIAIGTQVTLQVLWPSRPLHKGSDEVRDNGLIVRLVAGSRTMLLLGAGALSKYALSGLLNGIDPRYLQADIVQFTGEVGKAFPTELSSVLQKAHPSYLVITPAVLSVAERKKGVTSTILPISQVFFDGPSWQILQTAQVGTLEISSSPSGWNINAN